MSFNSCLGVGGGEELKCIIFFFSPWNMIAFATDPSLICMSLSTSNIMLGHTPSHPPSRLSEVPRIATKLTVSKMTNFRPNPPTGGHYIPLVLVFEDIMTFMQNIYTDADIMSSYNTESLCSVEN